MKTVFINPHFKKVREKIEQDLQIPFLRHMFRLSMIRGDPDFDLILVIDQRLQIADKRFRSIPF